MSKKKVTISLSEDLLETIDQERHTREGPVARSTYIESKLKQGHPYPAEADINH